MWDVVYLDDVKSDVNTAKQWYATQQDSLEIRFENSVKDVIKVISTIPFVYAVKYRNVRIAHTKNFPFILLPDVHLDALLSEKD